MTPIQILSADFSNSKHCHDILFLLSQYATDLMGGGEDLSPEVKERLIPELQSRSDAVVLLAYENENPVALSIAFEGFSTFYAKPLLNIHDFVVIATHRGRGIAKQMLEELEAISVERGYCKLTLEVLEGNKRAQKVYQSFGFAPYELDETIGKALFWNKKLV
jgi:ribosomal protein S18 acetylase RimI-like enzyme